jgi:HPt (histidine-containing phosphotransfer) domain-containing protein
MHIYWVRTTPLQMVPNAAGLLKMGVVLKVLESVQELALLRKGNAASGLLIVDQSLASSAAMRALGIDGNGASMKAMPMIALADAATEEEMRACRDAGAVDMVPHQFALNHLSVIGERYLNQQGEPRADMSQNIAAIDSQSAMENMQSDSAFFGSLLSAFLAEIPTRRKQLRDDWFNNSQLIKHQSHALKGLAMTLGLHQLAEVAQQTEARAAQGVGLDIGLLAQFEGELQSASFQILRWLQLNKDRLELTP